MKSTFARGIVLSLLPVTALLAGPTFAVARPAKTAKVAKVAAAKRKPTPAVAKPVPASASSESPSPSTTSAAADESSSKSDAPAPAPVPAAASATETPKEASPAVETESAAAKSDESASAESEAQPDEPAPRYVEHLGLDAYPGQGRGLHGGSLWLEPSLHGLQSPYMAKTGVGVSGLIWLDSGYQQNLRDSRKLPNTSMFFQQGRAVLRVTPTYAKGNFFIQGQVELVGNECQNQTQALATDDVCARAGTFHTDDLWIRVGQWNSWDLKVGRFEGWEVYHTGMGLDMYTLERQGAVMGANKALGNIAEAPTFYGVNYLHDRPTAGLGIGYLALHAYPTDYLRFELLGELGADNIVGAGYNYVGGRPTAILDFGWFKFKLGGEYEKKSRTTDSMGGGANAADPSTKVDQVKSRTRFGGGASAQVIVDPTIEFGANVAYGKNSQANDSGTDKINTTATVSAGGFVNWRPANLWLVGAGFNWTTRYDSYYAKGETVPDFGAHLQAFSAIQYLLAKQLYIKAVLGFARADFQDTDRSVPVWSNFLYSFRMRLMYLY